MLRIKGYSLTAAVFDQTAAALAVVSSELSWSGWTAWVEASIGPI